MRDVAMVQDMSFEMMSTVVQINSNRRFWVHLKGIVQEW